MHKIPAALTAAILISATTIVYAQAPAALDTPLITNSRVKVTIEDLVAEMERLPEDHRIEFLLNEERVVKLLENMMVNKVMATEAMKSGLQNDPGAAAEIRNQTEKILAKYRKKELEKNAPKIDLAPIAREIFLTRMKGMERPAMYASWHTLIKIKNRTRDDARVRAELVKSKIEAGEKLEAIAKEYSDDESAATNNGYINATPLSYLDRAFGSALEKLKLNEMTIVESEYGFHVVRLISMTPSSRPTFEEVKPQMIAEADKAYKQRILNDYLNDIRGDATVKLQKEAIDKLRPRLPEIPPPPAAPATRAF